MENTKPTIVIGLGNPLMADEGIGVVLIEKLAELAAQGQLPQDVDYHDGGCGGMYLLHAIAGREKVILIDCAKMGTAPGTIRRFTPDDVQTVKKLAHLSLHEIDIIRVLDLARMIDQCPSQVVIFGIEPVTIEPRQSLTPLLENRLSEYLQVVTQELLADNKSEFHR